MFLHLEAKRHFGKKLATFECMNFPNAYFQIAFHNFWQESGFFAQLMMKQGHSLLLISKKRQDMALFEKRKTWILSNFVTSLFFSFWILWKIHFFHIEFCEEFVFLMLNFVKCLKMDSISPPRQTPVHNAIWNNLV